MSNYAPGAILDFKFSTFLDAVPTTLAGSPVVSVYKNNSVTQTTTGVTLSVDFDGITGCHNVRVDTSADGTFYAAGSSFQLIVTTGTIGAESLIGFVIDQFDLTREIVNATQIGGQTASAAGAVTFPGTIASTTNITAGTITTVTNLTNAASAGDFTATMKTSIGTAVAASAVASVTGNVGGNVTGSVGSVTGLTASNLDATISSRMATYVQPTGFLAANFSTGIPVSGTVTLAESQNSVTFNSLTVTNATTLSGAVSIGGTLTTGDIAVGGFLQISGAFTVIGTTTIVLASSTITASSIATGAITSAKFAAGTTIPRVTLADTVTTVTGLTASNLDATVSSRASAASLTTAQTAITKIQAAVYDSLSISGSTLTLSNAATMVVTTTGRVTT